jgi:hypothetical protein
MRTREAWKERLDRVLVLIVLTTHLTLLKPRRLYFSSFKLQTFFFNKIELFTLVFLSGYFGHEQWRFQWLSEKQAKQNPCHHTFIGFQHFGITVKCLLRLRRGYPFGFFLVVDSGIYPSFRMFK